MIYVGIDFSISSAGLCIHDEEGKDHFFNAQRNKLPKKYMEVYDNTKIDILPLEKMPTDLGYSETEVLKIKEAKHLASVLMTQIGRFGRSTNIRVGIEGFSYGGIGSRTLDLAGFQYVLRSQLIEAGYVQNFKVYTPGEIKKFAIKGNASKEQMMEAYLELNENNELTRVMKNEVVSSASKFPKPIDDLVDAFFISRLLKENFS
jgi:hypothetical protein